MRGEGRQPGGALIHLLVHAEGWLTAAHGVAAPARGGGSSAKRKREMIPSVGHLGPEWTEPPGDLGRL
jgi:hypothetical protein